MERTPLSTGAPFKSEHKARDDMARAMSHYKTQPNDRELSNVDVDLNEDPKEDSEDSNAAAPSSTPRKASDASSPSNVQASPSPRKSARLSGKKPVSPSPVTTVQKHTGRYAPISSALKAAKYISKAGPASEVVEERSHREDNAIAVNTQSGDDATDRHKHIVQQAVAGTGLGFGTTLVKDAKATLDIPWNCANRICQTGMTWQPRDGAGGMGRKVISHFFGRNKKQTNIIHPDVWHVYCRKDYQRPAYAAEKAGTECQHVADILQIQLDRIRIWRPQATFAVVLNRGARARVDKYYRELHVALSKMDGAAAKESAKAAVAKAPVVSKGKGKAVKPKSEDRFPIEEMEHFENHFCQEDQSFDDIKAIIDWARTLAENGTIDCMPPMELLISEQRPDEVVVDPTTNYFRWIALEDGVPYGDEAEDGGDGGMVAEREESGEYIQSERQNNQTGQSSAAGDQEDDETDGTSDVEDEDSHTPTASEASDTRSVLTLTDGWHRPISTSADATPGSGYKNKRKALDRLNADTDDGAVFEERASKRRRYSS